jgi:BlaI family transcriptional regulator, penicillinase repressor
MAEAPQRDVSDTELDVLQVLWDRGGSTIRQITDLLYPDGGPPKYWTVQKLLERLQEKGYVLRERSGPAHTFAATVGREELIGRRLRDVAEKLCGGSLTPLLTHLVRNRPLSAEERQGLRDLIDELDQESKARKPRRS